MSNYERKEGDIIIFKNRSENQNAPTYKGTVLMNGQEMTVSLWVKEGAKGKFFAGKVEPKFNNDTRPTPSGKDAPVIDRPSANDSDDLPF
jgi:hypothetical protein